MAPVKSSQTRVWVIEGDAGPLNSPQYMACLKMGDPSWGLGDVEKIECPDPSTPGKFIEVDQIQGAVERVTASLMGRYPLDTSDLLRLARKACTLQVLAHVGACRDMRDFNTGWEKILAFPKARLTSYGIENLGALSSDENAATNETVDVSASEMYEINQINFEELAAATVVREIVSIDVCDNAACGGDCGPDSDGCQKVLAVMLGTGATPGTLPSVIYSSDGGSTVGTLNITTMFSNEVPTDSDCMGAWFIVLASTSNSYHMARVSEVMAGTGTWTEVINGFVSGGEPQAIYVLHSGLAWIVGNGGYIYKLTSAGSAVTVSDAGNVTTQAYRDVYAYDSDHAVAVGAINTVAKTSNGGNSWQAVTGPNPGIGLNCVYMFSGEVWLVGDAAGKVWRTINAGTSWTEITVPGSLTAIDRIRFSTTLVGYITGRTSASARMLRTVGGGAQDTWYVMPEKSGTMPANNRLNDIAVCGNPNVVYAAGLATGGSDGIIVKAS